MGGPSRPPVRSATHESIYEGKTDENQINTTYGLRYGVSVHDSCALSRKQH